MWEKELEKAIEAARKAREVILEVYNRNFDVEIKEDASPVTEADKRADQLITKVLKEAFSTYAFLTEESEDNKDRLTNDYVWIVDPVDGTKDFVARDGGFTTNIALAYKHESILGVICIPVTGEIYFAVKGQGAYYLAPNKEAVRIHVNDKTQDLTVLTSVFHHSQAEKDLIEKHSDRIKHIESCGSSIKACRIAEGKAEISYRTSPYTKEWDTAACQIILEEAGGLFLDPKGNPLRYNRVDVYNRDGYIMVNKKENVLW